MLDMNGIFVYNDVVNDRIVQKCRSRFYGKGENNLRLDSVRIVSAMKKQRLTSMELAQKALCGLSTVQSARNERSISKNSAKRIAAALGVPLEELLETEG